MDKFQCTALCASLFAGCFLGTYLANRQPVVAHAQNRVQVNDYLTVGNGGLRLMTPNGQLVGLFSLQQNGLGLTLMNSSGAPGVTLSAGSGGNVAIGSNGDGAGIVVTSPNGNMVEAMIRNGEPILAAGTNGRMSTLKGGNDPSLRIPGKGSTNVFELKSVADGGQFIMNSRSGKKLIDLITNLEFGQATFEGPESSAVDVIGKGILQTRKGTQTVWSATKDAKAVGGPPGSTGGN